MNTEDMKKIISMVKTMPESHKLLKNLVLDYLAVKEQNEKLILSNLALMEDVKQYEFLLQEFDTKELEIN